MATELATRSPSFIDGKAQNAQELRLHALSSGGGATPLASRGGVRPSGGNPGLVAALATPVMKVRVNAGIADIPSASATGGVYRASWDQADLDIDPSSAQARTDLIIVEVVDTGTSAATGKVRILKGTSGAGRPSNPVANAHWFSLGAVAVRVGAESGGNIRAQDVTPEPRYAVAPGAPIPISSKAERDALESFAYLGLSVLRLDTPNVELERWVGGSQKWINARASRRWTTLSSGTDLNAAYSEGGTAPYGYVSLPGQVASLTVPAGECLDVEFTAPAVVCGGGSNGEARIVVQGSPLPGAGVSLSTGAAAEQFPGLSMTGSWENTTNADVVAVVDVQVKATTGNITYKGGGTVGPRLRAKLL